MVPQERACGHEQLTDVTLCMGNHYYLVLFGPRWQHVTSLC